MGENGMFPALCEISMTCYSTVIEVSAPSSRGELKRTVIFPLSPVARMYAIRRPRYALRESEVLMLMSVLLPDSSPSSSPGPSTVQLIMLSAGLQTLPSSSRISTVTCATEPFPSRTSLSGTALSSSGRSAVCISYPDSGISPS